MTTAFFVKIFTSSINASAESTVQQFNQFLQTLNPFCLSQIAISTLQSSDRLSLYQFIVTYRTGGATSYHAHYFSSSNIGNLENEINTFLTTTKRRVFNIYDLTPNQSKIFANRSIMVVSTPDPWPTDSDPDKFVVVGRALEPIPPNESGQAVVISQNYTGSNAAPVYNAGPYTWKTGLDAIIYYEPRTKRLTAFPSNCNGYNL